MFINILFYDTNLNLIIMINNFILIIANASRKTYSIYNIKL